MSRFIVILFVSFIGCVNTGSATGSINPITYYNTSCVSKYDGFQLLGRTLVGSFPQPEYDVREEGTVVVKIKVDRNGYVVGAEYSLKGSTTRDSRLVSAAIRAAIKARFNKDPNDPAFVYGTITYNFAQGGEVMEDEKTILKTEEERKCLEELERQKKAININTSSVFGKSTSSCTDEGYGGDGYKLAGRSLVGAFPKPQYDIQESSIVVVKIKVDRNGYVVGAEYQLKGSTTQNSQLVSAAIKAAKQAKFNKDPNAPAFVYGTITYHFELD